MDLHRAEMRRDELRSIVQNGTALYGGKIAHLHHEGLTDMKPILNRGIGKRLLYDAKKKIESIGTASRRDELHSDCEEERC